MNVLVWHVHGSYTTSLVQGEHNWLVPVLPDRSQFGRGRADTYPWPENVKEVTPAEAANAEIDVVILQRPEELDGLAQVWMGGRRPGRDVPAIYLEHNAPQGRINNMSHPARDRPDLVVAHVTAFNQLFWDCGYTRSVVIEHGIVDPGHLYTGELARMVAVINEPVRRARVTGTDLLQHFSGVAPVDLFGLSSGPVGGHPVDQAVLHVEMSRRRVYLHPIRWTSLGLSLIEAMHLGMPVVALATTAVADAVPAGAGVVSCRIDVLEQGARRMLNDHEEAAALGAQGRRVALSRFGLDRFLDDWDHLLKEVTM